MLNGSIRSPGSMRIRLQMSCEPTVRTMIDVMTPHNSLVQIAEFGVGELDDTETEAIAHQAGLALAKFISAAQAAFGPDDDEGYEEDDDDFDD